MIAGGTAANVYTIPAGAPFVDALAAGILDRTDHDPLRLARVTVLLPTRRAARSLREAFLRRGNGQAMLLPRMLPLGDLDEDELLISSWEELPADRDGTIPPAISGLRRQLLLTRLIRANADAPGTVDQAARLAAELARFLDQVQTERLGFENFANLVPERYAQHWQETVEFLSIVTRHWPDILAEEGGIDPAHRRNLLLEAQRAAWDKAPPAGPVIAAGSTGTIPATGDLLDAIARLAEGAVVLPGLDLDAEPGFWEAIEPTHPQFAMARLLDRMDVAAANVEPWPMPGVAFSPPARARLIHHALGPETVAETWREIAAPAPEALVGVARIDCPGPDEEAQVIALIMREALEHDGRTASLVTPDRGLARRVAQELLRWDIEIDDSAGTPLDQTAAGAFLRLVAEAALEKFAPVPLLALFKHPLAAGGMPTQRFRALARRLEIAALRGPRPAAGLDGLASAVAEARDGADLAAWLRKTLAAAEDFASLLERPSVPLSDVLQAHVKCAEALAATDATGGPERLWADDAGEAAAAFVAELHENGAVVGEIRGGTYPALFDALIAGRAVRPRYGRHPRLAIWGLLEARLQHADVTILGGLNEGTWPPEVHADPWMSRPMREAFGLPLPERRIGLTAHDFAQAFSAPVVFLTRAERAEGAPTVPARWLARLENLLSVHQPKTPHLFAPHWMFWQSLLDRPAARIEAAPPAPAPPIAARPRQLSVTEIETWMRDPYAIYARHILKLRALDAIDAAPDAAGYGIHIHDALAAFVAAYPKDLPADPEAELLAIGQEIFGPDLAHPSVWAFWWPRFERIAVWFAATEADRRAGLDRATGEVSGKLTVDAPAGAFTLTARADRIDRMDDGGIAIVDYKTGAVPKTREVEAGFAPQLPLEAAIAGAGGFADIAAGPVAALDYWHLRGRATGGEVITVGDDPAALGAEALGGLKALVAAFDDERTPYRARPYPEHAPRYSDYTHLARIKEWTAVDGGDE